LFVTILPPQLFSPSFADWDAQVLSQALRVEHAALPPLERRAKSWARSVAFAQMTLGMRGIPMKGGEGEIFCQFFFENDILCRKTQIGSKKPRIPYL